MKVVIIGGGGREHALSSAISLSPILKELIICPGNPGIETVGNCIDIDFTKTDKTIEIIKRINPDLVIIGPEFPLVDGIVDKLESLKIKTFGPRKNAAKIEGSKIFAREFCDKYNIPQPSWKRFIDIKKATNFAIELDGYCVVKANGLAAGKGVFVCNNIDESSEAISEILKGKFGKEGNEILIEERISGPEISVFAIINEEKVFWLASAQDYKRVFDGDKGPNTGGMGAISPSPYEDEKLKLNIMHKILEPLAVNMKKEGNPYKGILYAGLMLTEDGPKVIEFNCRFGDPEAQAILPRLNSDLLSIICLSLNKKEFEELKWANDVSVNVVLASKGYPGLFSKGSKIKLPNLDKYQNCFIYHSGTSINENKELISDGGRVLSVTGLGSNFINARNNAYKIIKKIKCSNLFFREDIGK